MVLVLVATFCGPSWADKTVMSFTEMQKDNHFICTIIPDVNLPEFPVPKAIITASGVAVGSTPNESARPISQVNSSIFTVDRDRKAEGTVEVSFDQGTVFCKTISADYAISLANGKHWKFLSYLE